jgi:hypothetical protein
LRNTGKTQVGSLPCGQTRSLPNYFSVLMSDFNSKEHRLFCFTRKPKAVKIKQKDKD